MTDTAVPAQLPWTAPRASAEIHARVRLPGSKSQMARALVLSASASSTSRIVGPLYSRDSLLMVEALRSLGTHIDTSDRNTWTVQGGKFEGGTDIQCGLSGTVMRFVPPLAASATGPVHFDGDPHARTRPMAGVIGALRELGVEVRDEGRSSLPFTVLGEGHVDGGAITLDASQTSQLISGLLLAAPNFAHGIEIHHEGPPVPSAPYLNMATHMLRQAGITVHTGDNTWAVEPGTVRGHDWVIEPDLQNAAPFLAAPLIAGGSVTVENWPDETTQPGATMIEVLSAMGARVDRSDNELTVSAGDTLTGLDIDLTEASELAPTLAALFALASGPSRIRGVAHIRGHETDRIAALVRELGKAGAKAEETDDGLIIEPQALRPTVFETYADHRIAHAAAVLGLASGDIELSDVACTSKTMPEFVEVWESMLGDRS